MEGSDGLDTAGGLARGTVHELRQTCIILGELISTEAV